MRRLVQCLISPEHAIEAAWHSQFDARTPLQVPEAGGFLARLLACAAAIDRTSVHPEDHVMNKESVERLRFDRRLRHRADWIQDSDQEEYLASLPDVSEKMTTCAEQEETATEEPAAAAAPALAPAAAPMAGDFSTPSTFGGFGGESGGN
jgi:hypothetical protein